MQKAFLHVYSELHTGLKSHSLGSTLLTQLNVLQNALVFFSSPFWKCNVLRLMEFNSLPVLTSWGRIIFLSPRNHWQCKFVNVSKKPGHDIYTTTVILSHVCTMRASNFAWKTNSDNHAKAVIICALRLNLCITGCN